MRVKCVGGIGDLRLRLLVRFFTPPETIGAYFETELLDSRIKIKILGQCELVVSRSQGGAMRTELLQRLSSQACGFGSFCFFQAAFLACCLHCFEKTFSAFSWCSIRCLSLL